MQLIGISGSEDLDCCLGSKCGYKIIQLLIKNYPLDTGYAIPIILRQPKNFLVIYIELF